MFSRAFAGEARRHWLPGTVKSFVLMLMLILKYKNEFQVKMISNQFDLIFSSSFFSNKRKSNQTSLKSF